MHACHSVDACSDFMHSLLVQASTIRCYTSEVTVIESLEWCEVCRLAYSLVTRLSHVSRYQHYTEACVTLKNGKRAIGSRLGYIDWKEAGLYAGIREGGFCI